MRRGSVVGLEGPGSTSLLWSLLAPPTEAGSWAVLVGLPAAGLLAAADAGVALERLAVVAPPGRSVGRRCWGPCSTASTWSWPPPIARSDPPTPAASPPGPGSGGRSWSWPGGGAVSAWPEGADLRLALTAPDWEGLGRGHGHLQRRRVHLEVSGRREAARPRAADLWLPAEADPVAAVVPDLRVLAVDSVAMTTEATARTVRPVRVA